MTDIVLPVSSRFCWGILCTVVGVDTGTRGGKGGGGASLEHNGYI